MQQTFFSQTKDFQSISFQMKASWFVLIHTSLRHVHRTKKNEGSTSVNTRNKDERKVKKKTASNTFWCLMAGQTNRWNYRSTYRRSAFSSAHAHRKKTHLILIERIKTSATAAAAAVRAKGRRTNTFSYLICINRKCFFVPFLTRNWFLMPHLAHFYWLSM